MVSIMLHFYSILLIVLFIFVFVMQENHGTLEAQIESLLNLEKQMRLAGDVAGTRKAVCDIIQLCFEASAWKALNDQIVLLSKRRGQLKQVSLFYMKARAP